MIKNLLLATVTTTALASGAVLADENAAEILVTVNGEQITAVDRDSQAQQFIARGQQATDEQILEELVSLELMRQEALKLGLDKTPEMAAEMKIMQARVLANALLSQHTAGIDVTDESLRVEYDKQIAMADVKEYQASHILLEDEARAEEIIVELNDGTDFAEAAKKYSTGPSGPQGGDLGWFDSAAMVPEFSQAVALLETGKHTMAPVKTDFGWHIIKLNDSRSKEPQPFDAVKEQLRNMKMRSEIELFITGLHDKATIERK
ncbi:hypothetical protein AB833_06940 [Chromatiales bacterium (ex Bugula neritina AB1)]|nr:hypothetical protein AB833_06940 [Chromatiales bacterium (ex Bugula neritina AB1)]